MSVSRVCSVCGQIFLDEDLGAGVCNNCRKGTMVSLKEFIFLFPYFVLAVFVILGIIVFGVITTLKSFFKRRLGLVEEGS